MECGNLRYRTNGEKKGHSLDDAQLSSNPSKPESLGTGRLFVTRPIARNQR
jgi:hypothetical protein